MLKILRGLAGATVFFLGSFVLVLLALFRPFHPEMALLWCRWVPPLGLKLMGIKVEVRHHQKMKDHHPCVFIGNHQHALDLFVLGGVQRVPTIAIGKKEVKWVPFFGWIFWLTGNAFIDRKNHKSAMETMAEIGRSARDRKLSVWMFPEGTRSHGRGLLPFKKGAFHLAVGSQVPLVPVCVTHYEKAINLNRWSPGKIIVEVLDPIPTKGLTSADIDSLIAKSHEIMKNKIHELDKEVQ